MNFKFLILKQFLNDLMINDAKYDPPFRGKSTKYHILNIKLL